LYFFRSAFCAYFTVRGSKEFREMTLNSLVVLNKNLCSCYNISYFIIPLSTIRVAGRCYFACRLNMLLHFRLDDRQNNTTNFQISDRWPHSHLYTLIFAVVLALLRWPVSISLIRWGQFSRKHLASAFLLFILRVFFYVNYI